MLMARSGTGMIGTEDISVSAYELECSGKNSIRRTCLMFSESFEKRTAFYMYIVDDP